MWYNIGMNSGENILNLTDDAMSLDWQTKLISLKQKCDSLDRENQQLRQQLEEAKHAKSKTASLPSKEEIESISAMLDLVNKIDDKTLNRIERLSNGNKHE